MQLLNIDEAASFLKIKPATVRKLVLNNKIPRIQHEDIDRVLFDKQDLETWIAAGKKTPTKEPAAA